MDTNELIQAAIDKKFSTIEEAHEQCKNEVLAFLPELFEEMRQDNLTHIYALGYTPVWNDGEECVHGMQVFVSNKGEYPDIIEYWEKFDDDIDWENPSSKYTEINKNLTDSKAKSIGNTFYKKYLELLALAFDTDWKLEIIFTPIGIEVNFDDYSCEY